MDRAALTRARTQFFPLTVADYVLGLSDLTGELMRFAISSFAKRGGRTVAADVSAFVRGCKAGACSPPRLRRGADATAPILQLPLT
jgi:hypothetical protein